MAPYAETSSTYLCVFVVCCLFTSSSSLPSVTGIDQQCSDGTYNVGTKTCCLCAAGQRWISHCTNSPEDRRCAFCQDGQFNPHPTSEPNCRRCTSCSHHNENLEVDVACTVARDATCRCQQNHFCRTRKEATCLLCHPCTKCGGEGIKHPCTANNNTVCNEKVEGIGPAATTAVVLSLFVVAAALLGVGFFLWKRRQRRQLPISTHPESVHEVETEPFLNVDLSKHLPDIVDELGWNDMKEIATRSSMPQTQINFCMENHRGDSREQTHALLLAWIEIQGRAASQTLIQTLEKMNRNRTAERIKALFNPQEET